MKSITELKQAIDQAEKDGRFKDILQLRAQIARDFPKTKDAAEALYRIALYFLFVEQNYEATQETLEETIATQDPFWSQTARVSLANLYLKEEKPQKALLELRKVALNDEPASVNSISALSIMEMIYDNQNNEEEKIKIKIVKSHHLKQLIQEARSNPEPNLNTVAYYTLMLGYELLAIEGEAASQSCFEEVIQIGQTDPTVNPELIQRAQEMAKSRPV